MVDHTATRWHDPDMAFPGHNSVIVRVNETRHCGLHCEDCGWNAGGFRASQWQGTRMVKAWAEHRRFVQAGGVIEHGHPMCVPARICFCHSCRNTPHQHQEMAHA